MFCLILKIASLVITLREVKRKNQCGLAEHRCKIRNEKNSLVYKHKTAPDRIFHSVFSFFASKMMEVCGEAENRLASELMQHELQIEKDVLDPLSQLAEVRSRSMFLIQRFSS